MSGRRIPVPAAAHPGEADVLAAVASSPADYTAKLVYADWLDEHDDPRGAFLRAFVAAARAGDPLPSAKGFPQPWLDLVGVTIVQAAREYGLGDHIDKLLALAVPALSFGPSKNARGASRYAGLPDLPPDIEWPRRNNGNPLTFLCQIDLADLAGSPSARALPSAGLLSAFYYLHDDDSDVYRAFDRHRSDDGWRFFHFPPGTQLQPRTYPNDYREQNAFPARTMAFTERLELPNQWHWWGELLGGPSAAEFLWEMLYGVNRRDEASDRLLGYPQAEEWIGSFGRAGRALLSVGLTDAQGLWDDHLIRLHFNIAEAELRAGHLDRVVLEPEWLSS